MVNIRSGGTVIPFVPYEFQRELIDSLAHNQNTVILKSRQMGISECLCSWLLMRALTEPGFSAAVFSKTQKDSSDLGSRIRDMALSLGPLCPELETESRMSLVFKGLGRIVFLPVTARAARGIPSVSVLLFDEAAFINGIEGLYQAAVPTLAMLGDRGRVILNSTPNGKSGLFYESWTDETGTWNKVKLHYSQHPVYSADPTWAEKTKRDRKLTESQWSQEFELEFSQSDVNVFAADSVDTAITSTYAEPTQGRKYIAGLSPSVSEHFVMQVWDVTETPYQLAHEYRQRDLPTVEHIKACKELIAQYDCVSVGVRSDGGRKVVAEALSFAHPEWVVTSESGSGANKLVLTDRLNLLLQQGALAFPGESALGPEMKNYRQDGTQRSPSGGQEEGAILAAAIALANATVILKEKPFKQFDPARHLIHPHELLELGHQYDPRLPVHIGFDYNNNPSTALLAQERMKELIFLKEWRLPNSDTFTSSTQVAQWLKEQGQTGAVHVHSDSSGGSHTPNSKQTNIQIVLESLRNAGFGPLIRKRWPSKNPGILDSVLSCNQLMLSDRLFISSELKWLLRDLQQVGWGKDGGLDKSNQALGHLLDIFRYICHDCYPYKQQVSGNQHKAARGVPGLRG